VLDLLGVVQGTKPSLHDRRLYAAATGFGTGTYSTAWSGASSASGRPRSRPRARDTPARGWTPRRRWLTCPPKA